MFIRIGTTYYNLSDVIKTENPRDGKTEYYSEKDDVFVSIGFEDNQEEEEEGEDDD